MKKNDSKKILIVAAHPDDEILGCGGTISRMVKEGAVAYTLILGEGATARDSKRDRIKRQGDIDDLKIQMKKANRLIGVKKVFSYDFPDNRFDSVPLLDIVKVVEKIKNKIKPDIVFTHFENDLNIDHRLTYQAVTTATRPLKGESVKEIYSFEVLSSTEWNYPLAFAPNLFFDISTTLEVKKKALEIYKGEVCIYPHPRSLKGVELSAANRGLMISDKYAEVFKIVRVVR